MLAAADVYHAMTEARPHREALVADEAAAELRGEVRAGRIDVDAAEDVLGAAGHPRASLPSALVRRVTVALPAA
jgi:HD-GYP domain-containing protein (c-di-GMP phosphodiesterase class II)